MTQQELDTLLSGKEIEALLFLVAQTHDRFYNCVPLANDLGVSVGAAYNVLENAACKLKTRVSF